MSKNYGLDIGFADKKSSEINSEGKMKNKKISSVAAEASLDATDMPMMEGKRYYLGSDALASNSDKIIDMVEYEKLEKLSPLFLWKFLKDNNIAIEDIGKIGIGLSLAHIKHAKNYLKRMSKFKINNELFDLTGKLILVPQGVGAKYAIEKYYDNVPDNYLIIDLGFLTVDSVDVINNIVRPENVKGKEGLGIIKIARNVQEYISEEFNEYISIKEAKEILTSKKYFLSGTEHDLTSIIDEFSIKYTKMIMNYLTKSHEREFKKYRKIYFVGGGAYFIKKSLPIIEVVKKPEYANSIGNLLKAIEEDGK